MPQGTIKEIFNTPWGVLADRRKEAETASFGQFAKIEQEETAKHFLPFLAVAKLMGCSESTARRWINRSDPRFIVHDGCKAFLREEAERIIRQRTDEKQTKAEAKLAKASKRGRPSRLPNESGKAA